jgi:hypothetical protein
MLQDLLGQDGAQKVSEELGVVIEQLKVLGWKEMRSWQVYVSSLAVVVITSFARNSSLFLNHHSGTIKVLSKEQLLIFYITELIIWLLLWLYFFSDLFLLLSFFSVFCSVLH